MWIQRLEAASTAIASEMQTEAIDLPVLLLALGIHICDMEYSTAKFESSFHGVRDTTPLTRPGHETVDNHLDLVLAPMIDGRRFFHVV